MSRGGHAEPLAASQHQSTASGGGARPRVLHFCESVLAPSETFVQERLEGDRFEPAIAGWRRVAGGLEVPCPSVILPQRQWANALSLPARAVRRVVQPLNLVRQTLDILGLLARAAPAVVHAHFGTIGVAVARACEVLRIPLITSFYGFDVGSVPREPGGASVYAHLFGTGATHTAEGPVLAHTLIRLGARPENVRILPLGFPTFLLSEPERPRTKSGDAILNLLQVARFVEKKGVDVTLRAVASARRAGIDARLVLVGDGPLRGEIESLIDQLDLRSVVSLPGFVAHGELGKLFAEADVYVQPSRTAANGDTEGGHPTVLLEAQARAMPVLATTHADIPLVVRHGVTGLLCGENDHEALARNIVRLSSHSETLASMGAAARKMVLRRHDPRTLLRLRERLYREAIRRNRMRDRSILPPGKRFYDPFEAQTHE